MAELTKKRVGELTCRIITADEPQCLVLLCHGFGAPGDDLVQVGAALLENHSALWDRAVFVFPEAPLSLDEYGMPGGRAWWPLDMQRLNQAIETGDFRDLRNDSPELLPISRKKIEETLAALQKEFGIDESHTILGGFSQGAMLTTDVTLHLEEKPAGLIVWSGTLLNETVWRQKAHSLQKMPIVQSHGTSDQILPFEASRWLESLFTEAGADVNFIEFPGGHTIPPEAMNAAAQLIESVASAS